MRRAFASQASLIVGISLVQLVNGYMGTLVGIRLAAAGTDAVGTGIVSSAFFLGYAVGSVRSKAIIQRAGHIRAFAAFAALVAFAILGLSLYFHPIPWTIFRLIMGFGCAGLFVATESWLSAKAEAGSRGKIFSVYMVATYLTFGGSQFVLLLGSPDGSLLFELGAMILCVAVVMVATTRSEQPLIAPVAHLQAGELLRAAPVAVLGCLVAGINSGAFYALMPVFGQDSGFPILKISSYIALAIFGGMILQVPAGKLSDRFDRRLVAGFCALGFAAVASSLQFARGTLAFEPLWLLLGGFMSIIYPVSVAHANDRMPAERAVVVSGRLILISGVGSALGPLLGSAVMSAFGIRGLFYFMTATAGAFGLFALARGLAVRPPSFKRSRAFLLLEAVFAQDLAHAPREASH
ncbi:MAG TPA: MFS transporter [Candidatus Binatia bacterium]|nr:MFS transporter [Candidatus Binatia bacterium]